MVLIFFYVSMIPILLKFGQAILTKTSLPFCLSYSFFRLKTPVDHSNSELYEHMNSRQENCSKPSFTARIITKYSLERFLSICDEKMFKAFLKFCKLISNLILGQIIVSNLSNVHKPREDKVDREGIPPTHPIPYVNSSQVIFRIGITLPRALRGCFVEVSHD